MRGTSVRILLTTSSLSWCDAGADGSHKDNHRMRMTAPITPIIQEPHTSLFHGVCSLRPLQLPLLGESSQGAGDRTVPLHGATSGSSVRHVVCWQNKQRSTFWLIVLVTFVRQNFYRCQFRNFKNSNENTFKIRFFKIHLTLMTSLAPIFSHIHKRCTKIWL